MGYCDAHLIWKGYYAKKESDDSIQECNTTNVNMSYNCICTREYTCYQIGLMKYTNRILPKWANIGNAVNNDTHIFFSKYNKHCCHVKYFSERRRIPVKPILSNQIAVCLIPECVR